MKNNVSWFNSRDKDLHITFIYFLLQYLNRMESIIKLQLASCTFAFYSFNIVSFWGVSKTRYQRFDAWEEWEFVIEKILYTVATFKRMELKLCTYVMKNFI